ncbi:MAG: CDP-diacylglycerol--serine O-phosphatidyltransferase [Bacteriovoracaceae bacterium]|nr:CDP-diacylglycerol--serine O-phosphatidyltransferase [Bacteriovoracaceae bacterium]
MKKLKKLRTSIGKNVIHDSRKLAFFLPNIFTALNLACGFISIVFIWNEKYYVACMILMLGVIFDMVDGRIARLTGTQSDFGEQFDSMSDIVTFGVAPSMLVYNRFFVDLGRLGLVVSFLFLLCGALRLARFNANVEKVHPNFFQGLPIPAAAVALVGYVLLSTEFDVLAQWSPIAVVYVIFYGVLMISNVPFCSFKKSEWMRAYKKRALIVIFLILAATCVYEQFMIPLVISIYVVTSLIYFLFHMGELRGVFDWKNE